jgi:hypothetical protein
MPLRPNTFSARTRGALHSALVASVVATSWAPPAELAAQTPEGRPRDGAAAAAPGPGDYQHEAAPRATAVRATVSIDVDGRLVEAVWTHATPITDFIQELPLEGEPSTQRTEVRVAYDDDALYIGAMLYDDDPLTQRMNRRDAGRGDFDFLTVSFDSFHDHETSYAFSVNPSGSYRDAVSGGGGGGGGGGRGGGDGGGGGGDTSWDPVWTRAVQVTDRGWSAEMRIPFSQLRFSRDAEQVWGIHVSRNVHRSQERTVFPFIPTLERGGPSRYAHLDGISGVEPGRRLELLPYATARGEYLNLTTPSGVTFGNPFRSGADEFGDAGVDFKYRLTSNVTLDATVNPDFGQVELDPSVINLTDFETRYEERRPFFVEGADIFNFGEGGPMGSTGRPPQLLYSRRIGRAPQGSLPASTAFSDIASTTTILGAAKVTGRTTGGWSLGFLGALTGEETARYVDTLQVNGESVVEPMTNYLVGRVRRQVRGGETRFGVIGAAVNRSLAGTGMDGRLHSAAYSGGVDFAHEWSNRTYKIAGVLTTSYVRGDAAAIQRTQRASTRYYQRPDAWHLDYDPTATSLAGTYGFVDFNKQAGAFRAKTSVSLATAGYEVNDLGFQPASDRVVLDTNFQYNRPTPGRFFRNWSVRGSPDGAWNFAGDVIHREINGNVNVTFLNYWSVGTQLRYNPRNDDDRLTRGGPIARTPRRWGGMANLSSDSRRPVIGRFDFNWGNDEVGGWSRDFNASLTATPTENLRIQFGPSLSRRFETAQFVTSVADALATGTYGRRYLFADLDQTTLSLETRLDVTLSPAVSLQLYVEPFVSTGDYQGLKELARRRSFEFLEYGESASTLTQDASGLYTADPDGPGAAPAFTVSNRDFSFRSLLGNAVLRWEWRAGSTLYLVWQQRRIDSLTNRGPNGTDPWVGGFDLSRDVADMFGAKADNIFAIKVNYWLNP